ncbi:MAG TPA: hypothetical protein VN228_19415 [Pyrinomonadaceae bacterium]|nr:hypothetical protein [Pyrinomonadaceae bacterium]
MPVIGRLDGQVDEVLIKPLERGRRPEPPEAPAGDARTPPPEPAQEPPRRETSDHPAELPVWML